jgi:hypothetical protein
LTVSIPIDLEGVHCQKTLSEIMAWMYFPSAQDQDKRLTAEEIFNALYMIERRHHLLGRIKAGSVPPEILSEISCLLNLPDNLNLQDHWIYKPFTLYGLNAESSRQYMDHLRVFVLLMECLENGDGSFEKVFKTLGLSSLLFHPKRNKKTGVTIYPTHSLLKELGHSKEYRKAYQKFRNVAHLIMGFHISRYIFEQSVEDQRERFDFATPDDITLLFRWCAYFGKKLMSLSKSNTKKDRSHILSKEMIAPIDLDSCITLSDEDFLRMDQQRETIWSVMRSRIIRRM